MSAAAMREPAPKPEPVIMPTDRTEYDRMRDASRRPGLPCCATAGPVGHWPSWFCRGGNGPGKPIRAHCTCDSCF
jgi:hypothetical protein